MADEKIQMGRFGYTYAACEYKKYEATTKVYKKVIDLIDAMLKDTKNNSLELRALKGDIYADYMDHSRELAYWKADYDKEHADEIESIRQAYGVEEAT